MRDEGTIYIHPGLGKTATSAIQHIAITQLKGDILYFPFGLKGDVHNYLSDVHPIYDEIYFESEMAKVNQLDKKKSYLISSEFLCYSTEAHIKNLCNKIITTGFKIKVVFASRDLLSLIQSSYLQSLKSMHGLINGESLFDFYKRNKQQFSIDMLVRKWAVNDGVDIAIIEFDKYGGNFVEKFFEYLGVKVTGSHTIKNSSIHSGFIELITTLDKSIAGLEIADRQKLIELLIQLSDKYKGSIKYESSDLSKIEADLASTKAMDKVKELYENI